MFRQFLLLFKSNIAFIVEYGNFNILTLLKLILEMMMDNLKGNLDELNESIMDLESQIAEAEAEAQDNIMPLESELEQVRIDKRSFASKNDFESVQDCNRRESNLKFRINAQWNKCSVLKDNLFKLKRERKILEDKIKLEKDKIKRNKQIKAQMILVLKNYKKTKNLETAAIDSHINPDHVWQWLEWGRNDFNETYAYFYEEVQKMKAYFKAVKIKKLYKQMDEVIEAYRKTGSLKEASKMANVSYDTVMYWYEWGSRGFGEENSYFFRKIDEL